MQAATIASIKYHIEPRVKLTYQAIEPVSPLIPDLSFASGSGMRCTNKFVSYRLFQKSSDILTFDVLYALDRNRYRIESDCIPLSL